MGDGGGGDKNEIFVCVWRREVEGVSKSERRSLNACHAYNPRDENGQLVFDVWINRTGGLRKCQNEGRILRAFCFDCSSWFFLKFRNSLANDHKKMCVCTRLTRDFKNCLEAPLHIHTHASHQFDDVSVQRRDG